MLSVAVLFGLLMIALAIDAGFTAVAEAIKDRSEDEGR